MTAEENKSTFLRFLDELRKGNLAIIDEVCSPKFAFHSPNYPDWSRGLEGARELIRFGRSIFSDAQMTVEDIFAERDRVAVRWASRGIYHGEAKPGFSQARRTRCLGRHQYLPLRRRKDRGRLGRRGILRNGYPLGMTPITRLRTRAIALRA